MGRQFGCLSRFTTRASLSGGSERLAQILLAQSFMLMLAVITTALLADSAMLYKNRIAI